MRMLLVFFFLVPLAGKLTAQETFLERLDSTHVQFYLNEQYMLVDKACDFFAIRRVSGFDVKSRQFAGDFTDYTKDGVTLMTGTYANGKKSGTFKGFFPNGYLQWSGDYVNDKRTGTWDYYYSDGRPWLIVEYRGEQVLVKEQWDLKGKHVVTQGTGKFELEDPAYGFNEKGYYATRYRYKLDGNRLASIPVVEYLYKGGPPELVPASVERLLFTPTQYYTNAEKLLSMPCLVDDQVYFTTYLSEKLNRSLLSSFAVRFAGITAGRMLIRLDVDSRGRPRNVDVKTPFGAAGDRLLYNEVISRIGYWIPSQKDGKTISDVLTITADLYIDDRGRSQFTMPVISRRNGK
ncbi:toxin-antitoxin system YwqK family antitoxin [Hufsiella ginkgonis]|uniref:MORN repeat variant n=1 Tax=Hufsiella ginkgonis TaxID=2695274 RepID=A0A7K1XUD4_9SPHI|nr:hypothetical protein [Hufsiella ginkgonis]MXV14621.1 hypothetical protein [Hufsiella ginkgonis]